MSCSTCEPLGRVQGLEHDEEHQPGVVGLAHGAEHPGGDRAQMGSLLLEFGCQLFVCHISVPRRVSGVKRNPL